MVRRSVTIIEKNHKSILKTRAMFMDAGLDIGYTSTVNMLLDLGYRKLVKGPESWDQDEKRLVWNYISDEELEDSGDMDKMFDKGTKVLVKEYAKLFLDSKQKYKN